MLSSQFITAGGYSSALNFTLAKKKILSRSCTVMFVYLEEVKKQNNRNKNKNKQKHTCTQKRNTQASHIFLVKCKRNIENKNGIDFIALVTPFSSTLLKHLVMGIIFGHFSLYLNISRTVKCCIYLSIMLVKYSW